MFLDGKSRRIRQWYKNHVYRMCDFRILYEQEQKTIDPQEKKRLNQKLRHPQKKVEQHMKYGESLKIDVDQMRNFNLAIIDEIKKNNDPKRIIQTLIKENGQN